MTLDPRLTEIDRTADDSQPWQTARDQSVVIFDNLFRDYLDMPDPVAGLRAAGLTRAADRLADLLA